MKKLTCLLIGAVMMCAAHAQIVEQGEPAFVYYSPKTMIALDFTYTVETYEPGIFAEYAEDMIGVTDAVKENKSVYTLNNVRIRTATETDYSRPHKVPAESDFINLLTLNENNLLVGYNLPRDEQHQDKKHHSNSTKEGVKSRISRTNPAPYPEEMLKAATPLAQANAVAKQIFHLREMRIYLLSGEVEHAPADGAAVDRILQEIDKQEQSLTALFVGSKSTRTEHKHLKCDPKGEAQTLYFSEENGFTDAENIDAETISVSFVLHPQVYATPAPVEKGKKKTAPQLSSIVYNLPGNGDISVTYKGNELAKRTVPIAQIGIDVPLEKSLFTGAELPVIVFSEKTGNIVSISK